MSQVTGKVCFKKRLGVVYWNSEFIPLPIKACSFSTSSSRGLETFTNTFQKPYDFSIKTTTFWKFWCLVRQGRLSWRNETHEKWGGTTCPDAHHAACEGSVLRQCPAQTLGTSEYWIADYFLQIQTNNVFEKKKKKKILTGRITFFKWHSVCSSS